MKWALTACAFAAAVGIAVATAAIKAENVRERRRLERSYRQVVALQSTLEFEKVAWKAATQLDRLGEHWTALESRGRE